MGSSGASAGSAAVWVPDGWGARWRAALAASSSALATLTVTGESVDRGYYTSNLDTKSWPGVVAAALQARYGDGGSGWKGVCDSAPWLTAGSTPSGAVTAYGVAGNLLALTGTWNTTAGWGPSGNGANVIWTNQAGATLTVQVRGRNIRVYTICNSGSNSAWTYSLDGAAAVPVVDGAGLTTQVTTITAGTSGTHTLVITRPGSSSGEFYIHGVAAENNSGVVVNNMSIAAGRASMFDNNSDSHTSGLWAGGPKYPAHLAVWAMGGNDAGNGESADSWAQSTRRYIAGLRDGTGLDGSTDLMLVLPHIGTFDTGGIWQDYCDRAVGLARSFNAALVNMWPVGRNSYSYWQSLGYWGDPSNLGVAGGDAVHLSDAGARVMGNTILPLLI